MARNRMMLEKNRAIKYTHALTRYSIRYFLTPEAARKVDDKTPWFHSKLSAILKARNLIIRMINHGKKADD